MKKLLILLMLLTACSTVKPSYILDAPYEPILKNSKEKDAIQGYDALGLAMYCDTYLKAPRLPSVGTLLHTFGNPLPCVEKSIKQGLRYAQIDLTDATCHRNRVCPPGTPPAGHLPTIEERARQVKTLKDKYPLVEFQLSPALEHDIKDAKKVEQMCQAAKRGCPTCGCINSPFTGARPPGINLELHGNNVKAYSVSNDGASIFDSDSVKYRTNGKRFLFAWFPELNLRYTGEKSFTPPLKRTCKPPIQLFRQARLLLNAQSPIAPAPNSCIKTRDLQERELLKTNAESYCNKDPRGNKPLFITKIKGKKGAKLKVLSPAGKEIGCFKYYGAYTEKGYHRWYMGDCSGQYPVKLYNDAGGEWAYIKNGNECIRFNTIRRKGYYR